MVTTNNALTVSLRAALISGYLSVVVSAEVFSGRITPPLMCIGNVVSEICIFSILPVDMSPKTAPCKKVDFDSCEDDASELMQCKIVCYPWVDPCFASADGKFEYSNFLSILL